MRRLCLITALAAAAPAAAAGLPAEADVPYQLEIVCRIRPHRVLTPGWCEQFRRDLRDGLAAALGPAATVKVFDPDDPDFRDKRPPLWDLVLNEGLEAFDRPAGRDAVRAATGRKTHFVIVDYRGGRYEVSARQHDGSTGLAGPVVRHAATSDRVFAARLAGLMVGRDFGAVATVTSHAGDDVKLTLKAGALGLAGWAKAGDVFAVAALQRGTGGGPPQGRELGETVVRLTADPDARGECAGKLFSRYAGSLDGGPAVLGFRCVRLGTAEGPVQLRLADEQGRPVKSLAVRASAGPGGATGDEPLAAGDDGVYRGKREYPGLAFARVARGGGAVTIPVPVLDGPPPTYEMKAQAGPAEDFAAELERLRGHIEDTNAVLRDRDDQLVALTKGGKKNREARDFARDTLEWVRKALDAHDAEFDRAGSTPGVPDAARRLAPFRAAIDALRARRKNAEALVKQLDEVVRVENDPMRQEAVVKLKERLAEAQARLGQDDFDGALKLYDEILKGPNPPANLAAEVKKLRDKWAVKSPGHAAARKFAYETWPRLMKLDQVQAAVPEARKALKQFEAAQDFLSPRRFDRSELAIRKSLKEEAEALAPAARQQQAEAFKKADADLQEIAEQARKLIAQGEKPAEGAAP